MRAKKIFLATLSLSGFVVSCSNKSVGLTPNDDRGNTVYITYDALDGYWIDAQGNHFNNLVIPTRRGVKWSKRSADEKPKDPTPNETGYAFRGWQFSGGGDISDDYVINENITIAATYGSSEFAYDTWENIIKAANGGLDNLATQYDKDYVNNGKTFVGLTRTLNYAGKDYTVRVIGEDVDTLYDDVAKEELNKVATLTFEFVDTIQGISYSNNEDNTYENSNLRTFLNNEFVNNLPEDFHKSTYTGLRKVVKKTNKGGGSSAGTVVTLPESAFAISLTELGFKKDPYNNNVEEEDLSYAYYTKHSNDANPNECRIKYSGVSTNKSIYWTRSPYINDKGYGWNINANGTIGLYNSSDKTYEPNECVRGADIAPCFCIGEDQKKNRSFVNAPWSEIIEHINHGGLAELKASYDDDDENKEFPGTFIGLEHTLVVNNKDQFKVRVIDEEHDTYKSGNTTKKAALTLMSTTPYTRYAKSFNDGGAKYFHYLSDSYTQKQCDSYVNMFEDDVKNAIKEVTKDYVYTSYKYGSLTGTYYSVSRKDNVYQMTCKCFIPSVTELGGEAVLPSGSKSGRRYKNDTEYYVNMSNIYANTEGTAYKYFADKDDNNRKPTNKPIANRTNFYALDDTTGLPSGNKVTSYYTRSPHCMNGVTPISNTHYYINVDLDENWKIGTAVPSSGDPQFLGRGQKGSVQFDYWGLSDSLHHYIIPIFCI